MKKRLLLLLILLLIYVLIPIQQVFAVAVTGLEVVGDASKTTTTTEIDDVSFTVNVKRLKPDGFYIPTMSATSDPTGLEMTLDPSLIRLPTAQSAIDVTITVSRASITTAGAGTITFEVDDSFTFFNPDDPASIDLTLTVEESVTQTYGAEVEVQGSDTQITTTAGTNDIAFTMRVTNTGSGEDSFTLSTSGVNNVVLNPTSISNLAASAFQDVTFVISSFSF